MPVRPFLNLAILPGIDSTLYFVLLLPSSTREPHPCINVSVSSVEFCCSLMMQKSTTSRPIRPISDALSRIMRLKICLQPIQICISCDLDDIQKKVAKDSPVKEPLTQKKYFEETILSTSTLHSHLSAKPQLLLTMV